MFMLAVKDIVSLALFDRGWGGRGWESCGLRTPLIHKRPTYPLGVPPLKCGFGLLLL